MVTGNLKKFQESDYYENYFNWYIPNVSLEEIRVIYDIYKTKQKRLIKK